MSFDYDMYFSQNFRWPIIYFTFFLICSTGGIIINLYKLLSRKSKKNVEYIGKQVILILFFLGLGIFMTVMYGKILFRGGMYLSEEKKSDAVERIGVIEERIKLNVYSGYKYYNEYVDPGWGETVKIDGISYHIITCGDFDVGDTVVISCLPKSKIILEINAYDGAEQQGITEKALHSTG